MEDPAPQPVWPASHRRLADAGLGLAVSDGAGRSGPEAFALGVGLAWSEQARTGGGRVTVTIHADDLDDGMVFEAATHATRLRTCPITVEIVGTWRRPAWWPDTIALAEASGDGLGAMPEMYHPCPVQLASIPRSLHAPWPADGDPLRWLAEREDRLIDVARDPRFAALHAGPALALLLGALAGDGWKPVWTPPARCWPHLGGALAAVARLRLPLTVLGEAAALAAIRHQLAAAGWWIGGGSAAQVLPFALTAPFAVALALDQDAGPGEPAEPGRALRLHDGRDATLITTPEALPAVRAAATLLALAGVDTAIVVLPWSTPAPLEDLHAITGPALLVDQFNLLDVGGGRWHRLPRVAPTPATIAQAVREIRPW